MDVRPGRSLRARQARADRPEAARRSSTARSPTTSRRWSPAQGCYAAFLTPKGKMLGDLRILDAAATSCCSTPSASRCRRSSTSCAASRSAIAVELHKRTLERGLLSLVGPRARRGRRRRRAARARARPPGGRRSAARPVRLIATDVGVDVLCDAADDTDAVAAALLGAGAPSACRGDGRVRCASSAAGPRYGDRPRRLGHPAGGRPQRARRELHQGLLRRPGDRRPAALQGQAQPPPARRCGSSAPAPSRARR